LIGLHQAGGWNHGYLSDHLAEVVGADPGVDALDRLLQDGREHHFLERGAVIAAAGHELGAIEVVPAEVLELRQSGEFDLRAFVVGHGYTVTRLRPERRSEEIDLFRFDNDAI